MNEVTEVEQEQSSLESEAFNIQQGLKGSVTTLT